MLQPNRPENYLPTLVAIFVILLLLMIVSVFVHFAQSEEWVMNTENMLIKELKKQEGYRDKPYKDSQGFWTIGYGHNLQGRAFDSHENEVLFPRYKTLSAPITAEQCVQYWQQIPISQANAEFLLEQDILIAKHSALKIYKKQWEKFKDIQKVAILDLIFNLGEFKYKQFKRHIKATKELDWEKSAAEILNSKAARQAPKRYKELAKQLKGE